MEETICPAKALTEEARRVGQRLTAEAIVSLIDDSASDQEALARIKLFVASIRGPLASEAPTMKIAS